MPRLSFKFTDEENALFASRGGGGGGGDESSLYSKHRRSFCRSYSSVSTALSIVSSRKSLSYDKIAQAPINLTVIKLDASVFEIEVIKMAKISDLKQAVESAFSHLPTKGPGKVSWRHVWAHFCLSFRGQKLLNDIDLIKNYGIKDGDELHFVRHVSIAYNLIKKRSSKRIESPKPSAMPNQNYEVEMSKIGENDDESENLDQVDNSSHNKPMLSHLFRGWFLYSRVSSTENVTFKGQANQSRWRDGFVGSVKSLFPFVIPDPLAILPVLKFRVTPLALKYPCWNALSWRLGAIT